MKPFHFLVSFLFIVALHATGQAQVDSIYQAYSDSAAKSMFGLRPTFYNLQDYSLINGYNRKYVLFASWNPTNPVDAEQAVRLHAMAEEKADLEFMLLVDDAIAEELGKEGVEEGIAQLGLFDVPAVTKSSLKNLPGNVKGEKIASSIKMPGANMITFSASARKNDFEEELQFMRSLETLLTPVLPGAYASTNYGKHTFSVLNGPEAIATSSNGVELYIADSGNNRVLIATSDGNVSRVIGNGVAGYKDGSFGAASLNHPAGLALDEANNLLYIADSFNHCIRVADLRTGKIQTVLGNGSPSNQVSTLVDGVSGRLHTPWDIELNGDKLMVVNAGTNQLFEMDVNTFKATALVGTGENESRDGKVTKASFANLTHATKQKDGLYFLADQQLGKLKKFEKKKVKTLNKSPKQNKQDRNVSITDAAFNRPAGMTFYKGEIWLCDALNHQVKVFAQDNVSSLLGSGAPGYKDGSLELAAFNTPVDVAPGMKNQLIVCDKGNNSIRKFDSKTGKVSTIRLTGKPMMLRPVGVHKPQSSLTKMIIMDKFPEEGVLELDILCDGMTPLAFPNSTATLLSRQSGSLTDDLKNGKVYIEFTEPAKQQGISLQLDLTYKLPDSSLLFAHHQLFIIEQFDGIRPNASGITLKYDVNQAKVLLR